MTRVLLEEEHELAVLFPNVTVGEWNKSFSEVVPNPLMAGDDDVTIMMTMMPTMMMPDV